MSKTLVYTKSPSRRMPPGSRQRFIKLIGREWMSITQLAAMLRDFIPPECALRNNIQNSRRAHCSTRDFGMQLDSSYRKVAVDFSFEQSRMGRLEKRVDGQGSWYRLTAKGVAYVESLS